MGKTRTNRVSCRPEWCAKEITLEVISGMWKMQVVYYLLSGTKRYGELKELIRGVTDKMLAQQLRELEADEVISRVVYPEVPPRVEYTLTDAGRALAPVLDALDVWSSQNLTQRVRAAADRARTREAIAEVDRLERGGRRGVLKK